MHSICPHNQVNERAKRSEPLISDKLRSDRFQLIKLVQEECFSREITQLRNNDVVNAKNKLNEHFLMTKV